jgi:hypothetical protein
MYCHYCTPRRRVGGTKTKEARRAEEHAEKSIAVILIWAKKGDCYGNGCKFDVLAHLILDVLHADKTYAMCCCRLGLGLYRIVLARPVQSAKIRRKDIMRR